MSFIVPTAPADALGAALPLSARFRAVSPAAAVSWGGALPPLPPLVRAAVAERWGVTISSDAEAPDPLARAGFAAAFAQARADQVVRAFSRRTNLVISGSTIVVVGAGPIADALSAALTRIGSRVVRVADDPVTRLRAHLAGIESAGLDALVATAKGAHYVVVTGEAHPPLDPVAVEAVLIDASVASTGLERVEGSPLRRHVHRAGERTAAVVDAPPPFPADLDTVDGLAWHLADLLVALSLFVHAEGGDLAAADDRLAREAIA